MRSAKRAVCLCFFLALVTALGGCSKPLGTVKGQVVYKSNPVNEGIVNFHSKETGMAASAKLEAGKFTFADPLPPGTYGVFILPPPPEPVDPRQGKPKPAAPATAIPSRARDLTTSGVTATVNPGPNDLTIELID